jgi:hypothetical protein
VPFCPQCRDEFREGFDVCADCGVALVEELPPARARASAARVADAQVPLARYRTEAEAQMWAGLLQSNGIPAVLVPLRPRKRLQTGQVPHALWVREEDAEPARQLLEGEELPDKRRGAEPLDAP